MAKIQHKDIPVGEDAAHPPGYVQSSDPGAVGAHKVWVDTSGGTGAWVTKVRKANNSGWEITGGAGSGGAVAFSYLGYNTVGGSAESITDYRVYMTKVTVAATGMIASIGARMNQTTDHVWGMGAAVMTDSGGVPSRLIAVEPLTPTSILFETGTGPITYAAEWVHRPLGLRVAAGDYWLCVQFVISAGGTLQIAYDGSGTDRYYSPGAAWFSHAGRYSETNSTRKYSIRADFLG